MPIKISLKALTSDIIGYIIDITERRAKPMKLTLIAARVQAGLTQVDVSDKTGINTNTLSNYENGKVSPKVETAIKLAGVYNLNLEDIDWNRKNYK